MYVVHQVTMLIVKITGLHEEKEKICKEIMMKPFVLRFENRAKVSDLMLR